MATIAVPSLGGRRGMGRATGLTLAVVVLVAALGALTAWAVSLSQDRNRLQAELAAQQGLATTAWPAGLASVASGDGCVATPGTVCLRATGSTAATATTVATLLHSTATATIVRLPGAAQSYRVTGTLNGQPVEALITAHETAGNASSGFTFAGSAVDLTLARYAAN